MSSLQPSREYSGEPCDGCAKREVIFLGPETQKLFGQWLFNKERSRFTAVAHNGKSYDNYFLLYLVQNGSVHKLVYNRSKIMLMHLEKGYDIRVLDSTNFLPMRLAALPKAFGLKELAKGYFPHYFNTTHNWNYKGPYPPMEDYGIDSMSSADQESFLQWYAERTDEFDFQQQMLLYCRNDVQSLRETLIPNSKRWREPFKIEWTRLPYNCLRLHERVQKENPHTEARNSYPKSQR